MLPMVLNDRLITIREQNRIDRHVNVPLITVGYFYTVHACSKIELSFIVGLCSSAIIMLISFIELL